MARGKARLPCIRPEEERAGPGLECLLTYTRLNDCGGRGFALRDGQEPAQPHPANAGQSAAAEGGTDTHPGDPETKGAAGETVWMLPMQEGYHYLPGGGGHEETPLASGSWGSHSGL